MSASSAVRQSNLLLTGTFGIGASAKLAGGVTTVSIDGEGAAATGVWFACDVGLRGGAGGAGS